MQPEAEAYVNSDLAKTEKKWAWDNKMKFSEPKSKAMITRKRKQDKINIFLNNRRLEQVDVMKYLGIHFDSRLLFYKHIEQVVEKSRTLTYMLNRTAKLHWGFGHKSLKTVYEGAIALLLTYRAPVWEGVITKHKHLQKLQSAQRLINIKTAKAYRTISFETLCVIAGVPSIGFVIDGKVQIYKRKHGLENRHSMQHAVASTRMATPSSAYYHH
jgi:hypothetical protein